MKKLLSLFGLLGLLAFVATPIYAQEEDAALGEENLVEAENIVEETADIVNEAVDDTVDAVNEAVDDTVDAVNEAIDETVETVETVGETVNLEEIEDFNSIFENDEIKALLDEAGLTNEEAAWIFGGIVGFIIGLWIVGAIIFLVWLILCHIALWRIFWRAWEWKWKSLIPIYNLYIVFKISGIKKWFWYILLIILIAAILSAIFPAFQENLSNYSGEIISTIILLVWFLLAKKFGRGDSASILYVIFSGIAVLILWFWDYKYEWKSEKEPETIVEA